MTGEPDVTQRAMTDSGRAGLTRNVEDHARDDVPDELLVVIRTAVQRHVGAPAMRITPLPGGISSDTLDPR